jgi:hypothetical protein
MSVASPQPALCRRCQTAIEEGDLRCSVCALTVPGDPPSAVARTAAKILRCRECAAAVSYAIEAQAPRCAFCDSVMEVEQPVDPVEQAEWILPFAVDYDSARHALRAWLKSLGWFRPSDLAHAATVDSLHALHWAGWIFDAEAHVTWTADSNAGSRRSAWAPHAGSTPFKWDNILVSASRGLTVKEAAKLAPGFRLDSAQRATPDKTSVPTVESFDVQRSAARKKIIDAIEATAAAQLQRGFIPGSRFRNVRVSVLLARLVTRRVVLPTWVLAYRYKGTLYRALVHGQDPRLAFGDAPLSWAKIALVVLGGLVVLAGIAAIIAIATR